MLVSLLVMLVILELFTLKYEDNSSVKYYTQASVLLQIKSNRCQEKKKMYLKIIHIFGLSLISDCACLNLEFESKSITFWVTEEVVLKK